MRRLQKATTAIMVSIGIICVLGMAGVGALEIRSSMNDLRSEITSTVKGMREEGRELKYTIRDEVEDFKETIRSLK
ncbi:hypothetical protein I6N96_16900 [Enterococcus sp. BWM-S5]|uniref:Uncharacterized protein n=1 Tax=Enterococcus larvae TaxID=2794352 RepID=A0ABS4CN13_9ENTE|nr:hypothetical protein [Enterococcus larvae]MBP1047971.1 hypothetical protein [Enterococcus larvae]